MKSAKQIVSYLLPVIEATAKDLGYSVWDLEYVKEGTEYYLRITIDSPNGIDIDDCEKMSRAIDPVLDEHDVIDDALCNRKTDALIFSSTRPNLRGRRLQS